MAEDEVRGELRTSSLPAIGRGGAVTEDEYDEHQTGGDKKSPKPVYPPTQERQNQHYSKLGAHTDLSGSAYGTSASIETSPPKQHKALRPVKNQNVERQLWLCGKSDSVSTGDDL